jgi:two-component system, OmpR family, osmolarity sensor histidine kinase EnvZ
VQLRKYLPKTLFLRSLMILVTPVVMIHLISGYVFFARHWDYVSHLLSENIVSDINFLIDLSHYMPFDQVKEKAQHFYDIQITQKPLVHQLPQQSSTGNTLLDRTLKDKMKAPHALKRNHTWLTIWVQPFQSKPTEIWEFKLLSKRLAHRTILLFILWAMGSSILFLIIAGFVMRNQIRPLYHLEKWADALRLGKPEAAIKIEGAKEIRKISAGIRLIVEKVKRHFEERNRMLLGISHDLRTPLARMRLHLQMMPVNSDHEALLKDVNQMISMIQSYLIFAKQNQEPMTPVNFMSFFQEQLRPYLQSSTILWHWQNISLPPHLSLMLKESFFQRCLGNLLENARKHAKSKVWIETLSTSQEVKILIHDDGPGIAPELHDTIFEPFFRIDDARNLDDDGVGLGLSLVKEVIAAHQGSISVGVSPLLTGALFTITLPIIEPHTPPPTF